MKKTLLFIFMLFASQVNAQDYPVTGINISLPPNPDANMANWGTGATQLTITANAKAVNGRVDGFLQEGKILVVIKKNGSKICGAYTSTTAPAANFNNLTKVWSGSNAVSLIGQYCNLSPGDYELSVQFFGYSNRKFNPLSVEKTKTFTIGSDKQQSYQSPQALAPANETVLKENDVSKPLTFRWTPVIPRPTEPVTYRLQVWQLMQGQNSTQARTLNQPILTKDITNLTQATIGNWYPGPCKLPYLCDFIWNVQALNREGKPIGSNNGTSETFKLSVSNSNTATQQIVLVSPADGSTVAANRQMVFAWLPPVPANKVQSYKIKIVEVLNGQSPEQAMHTNKPFFEKDSLNYLKTNKPFFEKDSTLNLKTNKPIFEKDSTLNLKTNKPFFEKDSIAPPGLKFGKKYAWAVGAVDVKGNLNWSSASMFYTGNCDINLALRLMSVECLPGLGRNKRYKILFSSTYTSSTNNLTYTQTGSSLKAYHPNYSSAYGITNLSPALQTQNNGTSTTLNYSFEVTVPVGQTTIKIGLQGDDNDPGPVSCRPGAELDVALPVCTTPTCDCAEKPWGIVQKVRYNDGNKTIGQEISCLGKLTGRVKAGSEISYNAPAYNCALQLCKVSYSWKIINMLNNSVSSSGTATGFPIHFIAPAIAGNYRLEVTPHCGTKICKPCGFSFTTYR